MKEEVMQTRILIAVTILLSVALFLTRPQIIHKTTMPEYEHDISILEDKPILISDVIDVLEQLENPDSRKEYFKSLFFREKNPVLFNDIVMTEMSIIHRKGFLDEVDPKLATQYLLFRICPLENMIIGDWNDWLKTQGCADWWKPFAVEESEKIVFHTYRVGSDGMATDALVAMGRKAVPHIIDYLARQKIEGGRIVALICLGDILEKEFKLYDFLNENDWEKSAKELKKWWSKNSHLTNREIQNAALKSEDIIVRFHTARIAVMTGNRQGLQALLSILHELAENYERYTNGNDRYGNQYQPYSSDVKDPMISGINGILSKNLDIESIKKVSDWQFLAKQAFDYYREIMNERYDTLEYNKEKQEFDYAGD